MQRHTLIDRQASPIEPPDFLDALKQQIGNAADVNNTAALARLRCQAIGAFFATGRDGYRQLSEYARDIEAHLTNHRGRR